MIYWMCPCKRNHFKLFPPLFRFSSMAAERLSSQTIRHSSASAPRPSRVAKTQSGGRHQRRRNDRGMEVDQVGSAPNSNNNNNNNNNRINKNKPKNNNKNKNNSNNSNKNRNNRRNNQQPKKTPLNQSDLDKELEAYMMKNESTARNTLDMELDSYMSAAPSKSA